MATEIEKTEAGRKLGKRIQEATKTKEESKQPSPEKSVSSDDNDTRDFVATDHSDEAEEEEEVLPSWIRQKDYSTLTYEEADEELWKDLKKEDTESGEIFLEQNFHCIQYIFIDNATGRPYVKMPSMYHEKVVKKLKGIITTQSTTTNPVLAETSGVMTMTTGSNKYPDVFIFGQDRTVEEEFVGIESRLGRDVDGRPSFMNPNAIIEVSWTHNKLKDELQKFALQMNRCQSELGAIHVGYLIQFKGAKNKIPNKNNPDHPLLVGFDVYRMEAGGEEPVPGNTVIEWRYGENYPDDLTLTAEELGQAREGEGVSIPLKLIVEALIQLDVKFQETDTH